MTSILRWLEVELVHSVLLKRWRAEVIVEGVSEWAEVPTSVVLEPAVESGFTGGTVSTFVTCGTASCAVAAELAVVPLASGALALSVLEDATWST